MFNEEKQDAISILQLIYSNRKTFLYVLVTSITLSIGLTLLMPNQYYSFGTIFAPNSYASNSVIDNPQFGFEVDADHLMQVLESENVRLNVIRKFNLTEYYNIDTLDNDWQQQVTKKFISDITFFRTKYMSVIISATTTKPELSADIVNYIIEIANKTKNVIFEINRKNELAYKKESYLSEKHILDSITDKIYTLKQSDKSNELIYNHLLMANKDVAPAELYTFIDNKELEQLITDYKSTFARTEVLKKEYSEAEYFFNRPFPENYIIDKAKPQYKKASPSFSINCSIGVFASLLMTIVYLFAKSKIKSLTQELA